LATHGFFAPPDKRSALSLAAPRDTASEAARSAQQMAIGNEPGLLSGLAFAGANATAHENEDDGILTATEVATLDLSHVEVAVLSACQTGLGKVAGGEGVLGLQRAFQLGGARTTVTSLWTVSDLGTRVLMQHFYENLWTRGMSKVEALRQAQIEMLKTPLGKLADSSGRGLELNVDQPLIDQRLPPFYWAAFVLSGDWRWQLARPIVRSAVKIAAVAAVYTAACFCGIVRDSLGRGGVRRGGHFPAFVLRAPVTSTNACRERAVARDSRQLHWAELSMQEDLDEVDAAGDDTLNRILWFAARRRDDSNSDWTVSSSEIATDD
ncbi:MAG TPA: CHAT domain-containing protein, partial [Pirellulales bacterium]